MFVLECTLLTDTEWEKIYESPNYEDCADELAKHIQFDDMNDISGDYSYRILDPKGDIVKTYI